MRLLTRMRFTLTLVLALGAATAAQSPRLTAVSWMAGCWRQESPARTVDEAWMAPAGDAMLGMSRTVARGRVVDHEFLQIREQDGRLLLIATPARQPEATFTAVRTGEGEVVFENPHHDFPQRVIYRRTADGLTGRIEGVDNGIERAVDFPMRRVPCAGAQ